MVNATMEPSEPCVDDGGGAERGWGADSAGSGVGQGPLAPSGTVPAATAAPPAFPLLGDVDVPQDSLEALRSTPLMSPKEALPELPCHRGRTFHVERPPPPPPEPGRLAAWPAERSCLGEALGPAAEGRNHLDQSSNDATQALFWASICQAQQCVLELQGEIDRKKEPAGFSPQAPEEVPVMAMPQDWVSSSSEPFQLGRDSEEEEEEEESSGKQGEEETGPSSEEEEEEEEEEMDRLFYNNPLFQESPSSAGAIGLEAPGLFSHPEGQATLCAPEGPADGPDLGSGEAALFCRTQGPGSPVSTEQPSVPELRADDASGLRLLRYVPHCRSLSPLVITEGDPEELCPSVAGTEAQRGSPDRQAPSPTASVPESVVPGAAPDGLDPTAQGLLFSPSGTSLASALLLQDLPPETHAPSKPPLPPAKAGGAPGSSLAPSSVEPSPEPKVFGPWAPPHTGRAPSCAWAGRPSGTSPLQKEVAVQELLSSISMLGGAGRKSGSSTEGSARVPLPEVPGAMEEPLSDQEEEEEEEEAVVDVPRPPCIPDGDLEPGDLVKAAEGPQATSLEDPEGAPLFANGAVEDQAAATRLASRLYHLDGFKRSQVPALLYKNNEFSQKVAEAYLSFFEFGGQTLDQALRSFLKVLVLTGETQERERILWHFSQRYHSCNPQAFRSPDAAHTLTCAIMLLNTDLHGQNIGRSMSCLAFLANLEGLNDGQNFPKDLLKVLYSSIRQEKLAWAADEDGTEAGAKPPQPPAAPGSSSSLSSQKKSNPFLSLAADPGAQTFRQGLLARKVHAEADGKKTPWGKRGWKVYQTELKGMVLHFFKEEGRPAGVATEEPIGVHHALAEPASKYTKRPHVFRLQTADWRIFLFQAPSAEEMSSWVSRINLVAAMFSSPPFPAAVGSQRKFFRPILPTAPCKNSLEEQHEAHESCLDKASDDLLELQRNLPDRRSVRGRDLEEYRLRKEYLLYEKRRYETYVQLLEVKLSSRAAEEDLDQWEARLGRSAQEGGSGPSLQKSHSSPSLNAEGPGTAPGAATIKVKRNISERRTVRRIIPRRNKHLL